MQRRNVESWKGTQSKRSSPFQSGNCSDKVGIVVLHDHGKENKVLDPLEHFFFSMCCKKMLGMTRSLEGEISLRTLVMDQRLKGVALEEDYERRDVL